MSHTRNDDKPQRTSNKYPPMIMSRTVTGPSRCHTQNVVGLPLDPWGAPFIGWSFPLLLPHSLTTKKWKATSQQEPQQEQPSYPREPTNKPQEIWLSCVPLVGLLLRLVRLLARFLGTIVNKIFLLTHGCVDLMNVSHCCVLLHFLQAEE